MQQVSISMGIWLVLSVLQWIRSASNVYLHRVHASGARRIQRLLKPGRQTNSLVIALQEVQKTEVFLLLALQVVTLLALNHATWLDAPTISQLTMNAIFMVLLSTAGVYPIILGLLTLRKNKGHLEWFTLVTSLACVVVSSVTWARVSHINLLRLQKQSDIDFDECGGSNPMRYCIEPGANLRSETSVGSEPFLRQSMSIWPICVVLYLVLEKALPIATRHTSTSTPSWAAKTWTNTRHYFKWVPSWVASVMQVVVLLGAEAWLLWGNIKIFQVFLDVWRIFSDDGMVWTIGQVIAAGVWIPVFLEWLYSALRTSLPCKCGTNQIYD
jgi:hypothetical protein